MSLRIRAIRSDTASQPPCLPNRRKEMQFQTIAADPLEALLTVKFNEPMI